MYSEADLQNAVEAGALSPDAAAALRSHVSQSRSSPVADEEHFRLITGFNDIFVTIAAILLLVAMGNIGGLISQTVSGLLVAVSAWGLAEYFTRRRRMALPSIILMIAFAGGVAATVAGLLDFDSVDNETTGAIYAAIVAASAALASYLHWRRFMVPITIAALTATAAAAAIALIASALPSPEDSIKWLVLAAGILIFLVAMRWDVSDRERKTRRSDVAFWLHLLAAPAIAHPIFSGLGVLDGDAGIMKALAVIALYIAFGLVALAIDRRAILVSGLAYVLYALWEVFRISSNIELGVALATLVIGSALLLLSVFWTPIRSRIVSGLPESLQSKLPATYELPVNPQPAS